MERCMLCERRIPFFKIFNCRVWYVRRLEGYVHKFHGVYQ